MSDSLPKHTCSTEPPLPTSSNEHIIWPSQNCQHLWCFWKVSLLVCIHLSFFSCTCVRMLHATVNSCICVRILQAHKLNWNIPSTGLLKIFVNKFHVHVLKLLYHKCCLGKYTCIYLVHKYFEKTLLIGITLWIFDGILPTLSVLLRREQKSFSKEPMIIPMSQMPTGKSMISNVNQGTSPAGPVSSLPIIIGWIGCSGSQHFR